MEQIIEEIELLEHRIEIVNNKIKNTTNKKQRGFKRFQKRISHQT